MATNRLPALPTYERNQLAAFAAAKAGLRMVSQSFAREFGPRGIHVAHVIIDGSINGDKIFSKVPDIGQQKGPDGLLDPDAIADSFGIYIRNIVLLGRRSSMCVHMQNPLSLGRPISSHRRVVIFLVLFVEYVLCVFFRPVRVLKHRKEWKRPTSRREILPGGRRRYSIWRWDCPGAACPNLRNVAVAHPRVGPRREGRAFAVATASSHKAHCRRLQQSMHRRHERRSR